MKEKKNKEEKDERKEQEEEEEEGKKGKKDMSFYGAFLRSCVKRIGFLKKSALKWHLLLIHFLLIV